MGVLAVDIDRFGEIYSRLPSLGLPAFEGSPAPSSRDDEQAVSAPFRALATAMIAEQGGGASGGARRTSRRTTPSSIASLSQQLSSMGL